MCLQNKDKTLMNNSPASSPQINSKSTPFKWLLIVIAIIVSVFFLTKPLRVSSANSYIDSGDKYLLKKEYLKADLEYQKSIILSSSTKATHRLELVEDAMADIEALKDFYIEQNAESQIELLEGANIIPKNESDAAKESKKLVEEKEYQLAIIPAKTAVEMDKEYRDGWLYLGIANLKCAEYLELKPEIKRTYLDTAKTALDKASSLDPDYQPTKDFLKEMETVNQ